MARKAFRSSVGLAPRKEELGEEERWGERASGCSAVLRSFTSSDNAVQHTDGSQSNRPPKARSSPSAVISHWLGAAWEEGGFKHCGRCSGVATRGSAHCTPHR